MAVRSLSGVSFKFKKPLQLDMPILPTPIQPILILSLGGFWPRTEEGTIEGIANTEAAKVVFFKNSRLLIKTFILSVIATPKTPN
jgi:hypothetical protein